METNRFLLHIRAAEAALWNDNQQVFEGIASEVAIRYGLSPEDTELVTVAVRERLWEELGHIGRARYPGKVARRAAYQAATRAAIDLLPDEQRVRLLDRKRAKRRKSPSSARPSAAN